MDNTDYILDKLFSVLENKQINEVRIWCGAGISYDLPCGLPLGYGLSWMIFEDYMAYNDKTKKIWKNEGRSLWERSNEIISKYIEVSHEIVRPEIIISCVTRCANLSVTKEFYRNFSELMNVKYNWNHVYLAYFVYYGGTVFTTNFDVCIEKAYEEMFHEKMKMDSLCDGKVIKYFGIQGGEIIHLHGTFEHGGEAGASIENVMKGYDKLSQNIILNALLNNVNLFVGYSFSDDYDLNSLFHTYCDKDLDVFVCNHKNDRGNSSKDLPLKVSEVFGKYIKRKVFECKTTNLLRRMLYALTKIDEKLKEPKGEVTDWKSILKFPKGVDDIYKLIYFIELINQLQISYKIFDKNIIKRYMKITGDIRQELGGHYDLLQYNLFVNSSLIAIKGRRLNNKQLKQALSNRLENNFFRLNAIVKNAERDEQLNKIYERLQAGVLLTNDEHELISIYMRIYTIYYLLEAKQERFNLLSKVNEHICGLDYSEGEEVYMFAANLRYRYLLTQDNKAWMRSFAIYYDVGHLGGIISTLIAKSLVRSKENKKFLFKQKEWKDVIDLIRITKLNKYGVILFCLFIFDIVNRIPILGGMLRWTITGDFLKNHNK